MNETYVVKKVTNNSNTLVEDSAPRTFGITVNWRF